MIGAIPNPKRTFQIGKPISEVMHAIMQVHLLNSKYKLYKANLPLSQATFEASEFLSAGVWIEVNCFSPADSRTDVTIEVRRKIGSFDQSHEVTRANDHLSKLTDLISYSVGLNPEVVAQMTQQSNVDGGNKQSVKVKSPTKRKKIITNVVVFLAVLVFLNICNSASDSDKPTSAFFEGIKKEELPADFSFKILADQSDPGLEKNQLSIEISEKLTRGQLATLSEKLFASKPKQRRFYIGYLLPGMKDGSGAWAAANFDPDLTLDIIGAMPDQDAAMNKAAQNISGEVVGRWREEKKVFSVYVISRRSDTIMLSTINKEYTNENELKSRRVDNGTRYDYKEDASAGEYFILNKAGDLEFYSEDGRNFTTAKPL